jgi:uncharacterized membrane protein
MNLKKYMSIAIPVLVVIAHFSWTTATVRWTNPYLLWAIETGIIFGMLLISKSFSEELGNAARTAYGFFCGCIAGLISPLLSLFFISDNAMERLKNSVPEDAFGMTAYFVFPALISASWIVGAGLAYYRFPLAWKQRS